MKKSNIILLVLLNVFLLNSCDNDKVYNEINAVNKEVDYSILTIDNKGYSINNERHNYMSMAYSTLGKNSYNNDDYYFIRKDNNIVYFQLSYHQERKGKSKDSSGHSLNNYYFDIGLFEVDIANNSCQLLYDVKNVYPISRYGYTAMQIYHYIEDNIFSVQYNGMLKTIDVKEKKELSSFDVYDKEEFQNAEYRTFNYIDNNFYYHDDDKLHYYIYDNKVYEHKCFDIDSKTLYISQYNDYIYTYNYYSGYEYYDCYNIKTNERMDDSFLDDLIEEIERERKLSITDDDSLPSFIVDSKVYTYESCNYGLMIYDNDEQYLFIDEDYMLNNSKPFNDLYSVYPNSREYEFRNIFFVDNKILITFEGDWGMYGSTPEYVYELDILTGKVYYVGYDTGYYIKEISIV